MTVVFHEAEANQCRRPVEGTGMFMLICGAKTLPGKPYCEECRARLYQCPAKRIAGEPLQPTTNAQSFL